MIFFFLLVALGILFSIGYQMARYRLLWKKTQMPVWIYWVIQGGMMANFFVMQFQPTLIANEALANILMCIGAIYFMFMLYGGLLCIVFEVVIYFTKKVSWRYKGMTLILVGTLLVGVYGLINMRTARQTAYNVTISKQAGTESMKIVYLSDAHLGTAVTISNLEKIVEKVNEKKPDIICLGGDFFDHGTRVTTRNEATECLRKLKAKYGVYYVEGNHEVYLKIDHASYFKRAGIHVLSDETVQLPNGVFLAGRKDKSNQPISIAKLLADVPKQSSVVLLSHQPYEMKVARQCGVSLMLCGHTHGGQFPLGNIGTSFANDMNYGIVEKGDFHAITSSGIGGWGVPTKFWYKSEIVTVTARFQK